MINDTFIPAPGEVSIRNTHDIRVGDVIGYLYPSAGQGRIGVVDHIYQGTGKRTHYVVRHLDGTSDSITGTFRMYDIDKTNRRLQSLLDHNERTMLTLRHGDAANRQDQS